MRIMLDMKELVKEFHKVEKKTWVRAQPKSFLDKIRLLMLWIFYNDTIMHVSSEENEANIFAVINLGKVPFFLLPSHWFQRLAEEVETAVSIAWKNEESGHDDAAETLFLQVFEARTMHPYNLAAVMPKDFSRINPKLKHLWQRKFEIARAAVLSAYYHPQS